MRRSLFALVCLLLPALSWAEGIYTRSVEQPFEQVYASVKEALEKDRFFVVFEPDMGSRMAKFAEKWGEDYNRNRIDHIRSMVFCNIWYTNRLSNADPTLLGLCPLHLTVIHKQGVTTVLLPRLSQVAAGSEGEAAVAQLEKELIGIIERAVPTAE